jgi:signal transduction histidine kinase
MAYLVLHGAIWFALSEQRNTQVRLWCISGLISGLAVVLLSLREQVGDFMFIYVAQLLMLIGNAGRLIGLRMYLPERLGPSIIAHTMAAICYFLWFTSAYEAGTSNAALSTMFFGFYTLVCFDYFLTGYLVYQRLQTLGPQLLMMGGLVLCSSLGFKTVMMMADLGAKDIYDPGIDQYVMIAGQFIAITLINIGFLRIFLDLREQKNVKIERNLAAAEAEASMLERHRIELQNLLTEREEIIRQLTLSNKTAGMGALVASLAHELNQPLCAIRLNAQLVERKLNMPELDVNGARKFLDSVIMDNRRAADIITKLRGMFENSDRDQGQVNLDDIIKDTLALVAPRAKEENVTLHAQLATGFSIQGDATQLQQVILNLLNNAFDALDALNTSNTINSLDRLNAEENLPKIISIRSELNDDRLLIYVEDNGIGIPDELQPSVFELFKTNKAQGMGVGLWLSKTVINAHRGDIRFTSTPGEGTLFKVSLPTH